MKAKIADDLWGRLEENRLLNARPGLGRVGARFWSNLGLHAVWWLLGISLALTWLFWQTGWQNKFNNWLFGWLY